MAKYELYIGKYHKDIKSKYTFYSVESGYMLVFSDKTIEGFTLVPDEKTNRLTSDERTWLRRCKTEVIKKSLKENQKEYTQLLNSFLDQVENELEKELKNGK